MKRNLTNPCCLDQDIRVESSSRHTKILGRKAGESITSGDLSFKAPDLMEYLENCMHAQGSTYSVKDWEEAKPLSPVYFEDSHEQEVNAKAEL